MRQRTPDSQRAPRPFAGVDEVETGVKAWILRRRKMLAALIGIPISALFVKFGVADVLGADLSGEAELGLASLIVAALVERIPNKRKAA